MHIRRHVCVFMQIRSAWLYSMCARLLTLKRLSLCMRISVWLWVCFSERLRGEGSPLFNKKFNIVSFGLDNTFWCGPVTRQRDGCKYFGGCQYVYQNNIKREWNNITFLSLFRENKLHCQYCFVKFHQRQWNSQSGFYRGYWSRVQMQHNCIERCDILLYVWFLEVNLNPGTELQMCLCVFECVSVCLNS